VSSALGLGVETSFRVKSSKRSSSDETGAAVVIVGSDLSFKLGLAVVPFTFEFRPVDQLDSTRDRERRPICHGRVAASAAVVRPT
jgi:hypothetical protein